MTAKGARYDWLVAQETLILEVTEEVCRALEDAGMQRKDLAKATNHSKSHITQLLSGERNLTLRTVADLATAMGQRATITFEKIPAPRSDQAAGG